MKLYADERDHQAVRAVVALAISALARVEVPAALWRKQRIGELTAPQAGVLAREFEADFHGVGAHGPRFAVVAVSQPLLDHAASLVATHGLRAGGGVQLAAALAVRRSDPRCDTFACFDTTLTAAAVTHGFGVLGP